VAPPSSLYRSIPATRRVCEDASPPAATTPKAHSPVKKIVARAAASLAVFLGMDVCFAIATTSISAAARECQRSV
jgi:hypothetical protein